MNYSFANFTASMTSAQLEAGERRHIELENVRRLAMLTGLTKSSAELKKLYDADPEVTLRVISQGVEVVDHYKNTIELLSGAIARLYAIAAEIGISAELKDSDALMRALELISERPIEGMDN